MKEEELKADRELILNFVGWETYELKSHIYSPELQFSKTMYKVPLKFNLPFSHCRFHDDWNLLMLVVDKIESIELANRKPFIVEILSTKCAIYEASYSGNGQYWRSVIHTNKITAVYNATINFIKWYNTQEK